MKLIVSILAMSALAFAASPIPPAGASITEAQRAADRRAQEALPQRPKVGLGTPLRVVQDFSRQHPARIIESGQAPIHDSNLVFVNQFDGTVGRQIVNVYAGYYRNHPTQGVAMMVISAPDFSRSTSHLFNGPAGMGTLRITKDLGDRLILRTAKGTFMVVPMQ